MASYVKQKCTVTIPCFSLSYFDCNNYIDVIQSRFEIDTIRPYLLIICIVTNKEIAVFQIDFLIICSRIHRSCISF